MYFKSSIPQSLKIIGIDCMLDEILMLIVFWDVLNEKKIEKIEGKVILDGSYWQKGQKLLKLLKFDKKC